MNLPHSVTEEEFVDTVDGIANRLCDKFKFGYFSREDIKQECFTLALEVLDKYDPERPLANFLWCHLHNRLCNLKRNKYFRLEKPCNKCPLKAYIPEGDICTAYDNKNDCSLYDVWLRKNNNKKNLMNPIGISYVSSENEKHMKDYTTSYDNVANNEILNIIDANISLTMRKYWLQQRGGIKVPKKYFDLLIIEIHQILEDNDIDVSQAW
jgi:hypothetical protein